MVNKLQKQLETKLSKLGFKKQTIDDIVGKYDVMNLKSNNLHLQCWYECNEEINFEEDFHYVVNINNSKTMSLEEQFTFDTEIEVLNWVNKFLNK
jgi:hypothetical protein